MAIEFDTEKGDDLDTIRQRLTDAMAWFEFASRTAEPGFPRSPRLVPSALEHNRKRVVASVAYKRKAAIEGAGGTEAGSIDGRILGYLPDEQLADGAAELVTDGFFNVEDEPPGIYG